MYFPTPTLLLLGLSALTLAAPTAEPAPVLEERSVTQILINAYGPGDCNSAPNYRVIDSPGKCFNFGTNDYGAQYEITQGSGTCTFKSWANANCNGQATTHSAAGTSCIPIANKGDGTFYLTGGARSVSVSCT